MPTLSPGQLPGGLVTLSQYLQENQPAIDRTQEQLNAAALQPYTQALGQAETAAVPPTMQQPQPQQFVPGQYQFGASPGMRGAPGSMPVGAAPTPRPATGPGSLPTPVPQTATLKNNPTAQANLNEASAGLQALGSQAAGTTSTAGGRQSVLTSMFGPGGTMAPPPGGGYSQGDAAFDAALTAPTKTPNTYADVLAAEGKSMMNPGNPNATPIRGGGINMAPAPRPAERPVPGYANAPDAPSNPLPPTVPQAPAANAPSAPYTNALRRQRPFP